MREGIRYALVMMGLAAGTGALFSCGGENTASNGAEPEPTPSATATPTGTSTPSPPPLHEVRFVALGDTGTGSEAQYAVAAAMQEKCASDGCDFGVLLGDNFYNTGITSTDDPQLVTKFEQPYGGMPFPWYITLGNHDYGGDGAGYEFEKGAYQLAYAEQNPNFILPAEYYAWDEGAATFLGLGTNLVFWDQPGAGVDEQGSFYTNVLAGSTSPWRIALGHHPYLSNGKHGNAGEYDGVDWMPIANGENVKEFFDETLCGKIDLYLSGHDHSRQVLEGPESCPITFVVTGAGAKTTDLPGTGPSLFQESTIGFTYVVVTDEKITVEMLDGAGAVDFSIDLTPR